MVLERRADLVGDAFKHSRLSTYVIGRLFLAGAFFSPGADHENDKDFALAKRRHDIAVEFALMHFRLWGPGTAPSHLRNTMPGMRIPPAPVAGDKDPLAGLHHKWREWCTVAMLTPPGRSRVLAHQVLERAALYEMAPATAGELDALIRVLDALIDFDDETHPRRRRNDRGRNRRSDGPAPAGSRRHEIQPIFARERFGPDEHELAAAIARLKAMPVAGEAD